MSDADRWFDVPRLRTALQELGQDPARRGWHAAAAASLNPVLRAEGKEEEEGAKEEVSPSSLRPWVHACVVKLLLSAARAPDRDSLLLLGDYYYDGRASLSGRAAPEHALQSYMRAADGGSAQAMFNLGTMHESGTVREPRTHTRTHLRS